MSLDFFLFITLLHHIYSVFLPLLPGCFLLRANVAADPSACARCGFHLPNELGASFSSVMSVCERNMFCLFWIHVSGATLEHFPELYWVATAHLAR